MRPVAAAVVLLSAIAASGPAAAGGTVGVRMLGVVAPERPAVLSLVGARIDADRYARSCAQGGSGVDCAWFAAAGVDLGKVDPARLTRASLDPRVKAVVAVDPELTGSFSDQSLAAITAPVQVVNLGSPNAIPAGLDASHLTAAAPGIGYSTLPNATRFSAFGLCKPEGAAILAEEGGSEAICGPDPEPGRARIHAELAASIAGFLSLQLGRS